VVVTPDAEASRKVEDIDMIREFPDVFPDYLPRLPPTFEVDFVIDLMPRTAPISKAPNRMAIAPLAELKKQLQDGKRLHSLQLGCACAMFKEKGQINALVHWLPEVESSHDSKQVSTTQDRWFVWSAVVLKGLFFHRPPLFGLITCQGQPGIPADCPATEP